MIKPNYNYAAQTTHEQLLALSNYFKNRDNIVNEIKSNSYFKKLEKPAEGVKKDEVIKWIFNSWNTERVLRLTENHLETADNSFVLQWSFPQAYYSVYMLAMSFLRFQGQKVTSHTGVIDMFGKYVKQGKYPKLISFYCEGTQKDPSFFNIENSSTQICQILKTTRKIFLEEKRKSKDMAKQLVVGKDKKQKKRLSEEDWKFIADKVNPTSIIHWLYRKRIKSNYREISTYVHGCTNAKEIHHNLICIVETLNFIHEAYIYKMIGKEEYEIIYNGYKKDKEISFLKERLDSINSQF